MMWKNDTKKKHKLIPTNRKKMSARYKFYESRGDRIEIYKSPFVLLGHTPLEKKLQKKPN